MTFPLPLPRLNTPWRVVFGGALVVGIGVVCLGRQAAWSEDQAGSCAHAVARYRHIKQTWSPAKSGVLKPYVAHVARGYESCLGKEIHRDIEALNRLQLTDDYQIIEVSPPASPSVSHTSVR